jgi:hypothetical protein
MAAVVDRERLQPRGAKHLARRPEPLSERVPRERLDGAAGDKLSSGRSKAASSGLNWAAGGMMCWARKRGQNNLINRSDPFFSPEQAKGTFYFSEVRK